MADVCNVSERYIFNFYLLFLTGFLLVSAQPNLHRTSQRPLPQSIEQSAIIRNDSAVFDYVSRKSRHYINICRFNWNTSAISVFISYCRNNSTHSATLCFAERFCLRDFRFLQNIINNITDLSY